MYYFSLRYISANNKYQEHAGFLSTYLILQEHIKVALSYEIIARNYNDNRKNPVNLYSEKSYVLCQRLQAYF